jgi:hypothetical protein
MAMATDRPIVPWVPAAAVLLLWPALWNGYPIVFADTGTYLSQAIHHYAGWDRPIFYSLFMLPLHCTITVWPVIVVQALLAAWVLWLVCRAVVPDMSGMAFACGVALLAVGSWLPWIVSELMPDLFTPLLILVLGLLGWVPEQLSRRERIGLVGLAAFMIASQLSSLPLAFVLVGMRLAWDRFGPVLSAIPGKRPGRLEHDRFKLTLLCAKIPGLRERSTPEGGSTPEDRAHVDGVVAERCPGACGLSVGARQDVVTRAAPDGWSIGARMGCQDATSVRSVGVGDCRPDRLAGRWLLLVLPPALAVLGLCSVNLLAHGRFAVSPFGNVFLLARVIYDGPGKEALRHECPKQQWRLCAFVDALPPTSDDFLWTPDSPFYQVGGAKVVSQDAGAILRAALGLNPTGILRAAARNALEQFHRFDSGDGLNPWPEQVSPRIERDFPATEFAAYSSAAQQRGLLSVPVLLGWVHRATGIGGIIAAAILVPTGLRRRAACTGFLLFVLLALPVSAAITGALSTPHERYQSRIMWLAPFTAVVSFASLRSFRRTPAKPQA